MKLIVASVLLLMLAGCTHTGPPSGGNPTSSSDSVSQTESSTGSTESGHELEPIGIPDGLDLSGCHGIGFTIDTDREFFEPSFPPGWEPEETQGIMSIDHFVHACDRISWGAFERPIHLALESINTFVPAEGCLQGDFTFSWLLQSFWVDDLEVYNYARQTYGMPVRLVQFNESSTPIQDTRTVDWNLTTDGVMGAVHFVDLAGESFQGPQPDRRWFWFNGRGISFVDWRVSYKDDQITVRAANGVLPPPFLYGGADLPDEFAARSNLFEQGSVAASIQRFGDLECKKPL